MNCDNVRSCCSPYSELAQRLEETNTRAVQAYNLAAQGLRNPLAEDLTINADLIVNGNIFQYGAAYETHAEKVYTNDDYIVMRDGAVTALAQGDYSGFQVTKYDGTNDGRLVIDRDGTARVGDVGDEQPLATRDEADDLTDGHLVKWDAANLKLTDAGVGTDGMMELYDEFSVEGENLGAGETQYITVTMSATKTFAAGYDYFIYARSPASYVNITSDDVEVPANSATFNVIYQPQGSSTPELIFRVYRIQNSTPPSAGYVRISFIGDASPMDQPKLVSGTNIKTIGGVSLLGSGDIPAGGLNWTLRANNTDWSDMFDVSGSTITAKKHVYLTKSQDFAIYIPKGATYTSYISITSMNIINVTNNTISFNTQLRIDNDRISSNANILRGKYTYTLTINGSSISISTSTGYDSMSKNSITIYTAD